jgi:transposase-like protein
MKKQRIKISQELKEQILGEALQASCNISMVAKRYNLSVKTISKWRATYRKQRQEGLEEQSNRFIEITSLPIIDRTCDLKKVELTFDDYSCSIVGKINSSRLLKLVQLLEGGLC